MCARRPALGKNSIYIVRFTQVSYNFKRYLTKLPPQMDPYLSQYISSGSLQTEQEQILTC